MKRLFCSVRTVSAAVLLVLAGCSPGFDLSTLQADPSAPDSAEASRSIYAGRTFITQDPFHGTQIEYHGPNGKSALWYPGNSRTVPANWKIRFDGPERGHDVCWQYPSRSYNPVTGQSGGRFECTPDWLYFPGVVQIVQGDPFELASGRVPFPLPKGEYTAEELAKAAGIPDSRIRTVYRDDQ